MEKKIKLIYKDNTFEVSSNFRKGSEESILFIHGLGCSKDSFKDVWNFSEFKNYTILTFDLLGFGDSSKSKEFSYTMEEHAEICALLIEKLKLDEVHVVGHSMGGAIGLLLIEKNPSKIMSFINLEGNLVGEDCTFSREAIRYSLEDFENGFFTDFTSSIKNLKDLATSTRLSTRLFYRWLSKSDPYAFYRSSESLVKWSDSGRLLNMFIDVDIKRYYVFGEE
jgi:pimeloyl-ACP methyl ester carboxylesterase